MGAVQTTIESEPPLQRQGLASMDETLPLFDDPINIFVAGCAASTSVNPLIGKFMGWGYGWSPKSNFKNDFKSHVITVDDERTILQIWNLYGVGYFGLSPIAFRRPRVGLMMLYDVGDERSFERAKQLITDAQQVNPKPSMVLVGCHCRQKEEEVVEYYRARQFGDERDIPAIEITYGKEGVNVEFAFMVLVAAVLKQIKR